MPSLNRLRFAAAIGKVLHPTIGDDPDVRNGMGYDLVIQMLEAPLHSDPETWWTTPNRELDGLAPEVAVGRPGGYDTVRHLLNAFQFGYKGGR